MEQDAAFVGKFALWILFFSHGARCCFCRKALPCRFSSFHMEQDAAFVGKLCLVDSLLFTWSKMLLL